VTVERPFNVNPVDEERLEDDPRFPFGVPSDKANYLWIQTFYSALNGTGRAGFVMANSAADARGSEQEIRKKLIQSGAVDVMLSVGSNFFYTVTLPCTLWFLDRGVETPRRASLLESLNSEVHELEARKSENGVFMHERHEDGTNELERMHS